MKKPLQSQRYKRVFLDCSRIYRDDYKAGVQRVVRNLADYCGVVGRKLGVSCQLVVWDRDRFNLWERVPEKEKPRKKFWFLPGFISFLKKSLRLFLPGGIFLILRFFYHRRCQSALLNGEKERRINLRPVNFRRGDILVLIDSPWEIPFWEGVNKARQLGVRIGFMLYDLIPLRSPQFHDSNVVAKYREWLKRSAESLDFCVAISEATKGDFEAYLREQHIRNSLKVFSFRLGVGLDRLREGGTVRRGFKKRFEEGPPPYLCVGTIEPRKNHKFLLTAFEILWKRGFDARLCIIGKFGWMAEDIQRRIETHPGLLDRRLLWFSDLSDTELAFAYRHAKAVIIPSIVEGFGLPIIEGLSFGLPVFASGIPVFREVGGDFCVYFSLRSPYSLAEAIANFEDTGNFPARSPLEFSWPNWEESTREFLEKVLSV